MEKTAFARGFEKAAEMMKLDAEQTEGLRQLVAACDPEKLLAAAQEWAAKTAQARQEFDWSQMGEMLKQAGVMDSVKNFVQPAVDYAHENPGVASTGLGALAGAGVGAGAGALMAGKGKRLRGAGLGALAGAGVGGVGGYLGQDQVMNMLPAHTPPPQGLFGKLWEGAKGVAPYAIPGYAPYQAGKWLWQHLPSMQGPGGEIARGGPNEFSNQ